MSDWPAVVPEQPPLGRWWFGATVEEELAHRQALVQAAKQASRRERNFDGPWWAANVHALLEYVVLLEQAVADAKRQGGN